MAASGYEGENGGIDPDTARWIRRFARFGYAAKGFVYILVGYIALMAAVSSARAEGAGDALSTLRDEPFGQALLIAVAIGLLAYAGWRAYAGVANPENESGPKRAFSIITALVNAGLAYAAARIALAAPGGSGQQDGGAEAVNWTARIMQQPFGRWLVLAVGLGILGYGLHQIVKAYRADLDDQLTLSELDPDTQRRVRMLSRAGIAARGVVFAVAGFFLARAGWEANAAQTKDVGAALQEIEQSYGPWILGLIALGLAAFGVYELLRARYRRFHLR